MLTSLPAGFNEVQIVEDLVLPTAMDVADDGRIFVAEADTGRVRVVKNGELLSTPFVDLDVYTPGEHGLVGLVLDPDFASNGYLYTFYTVPSAPPFNRVSRFTASGDVAVPNSEFVLMDLEPLNQSLLHNGGALRFGDDGKLYVGVGQNGDATAPQSIETLQGKILRINPDGSIPSSNPFFSSTTGVNRAIWALGLRNPYSMDVQPGTGRIYANDVGGSSFEEINQVVAGANYGWPRTEGLAEDPGFVDPVFAYPHGPGPNDGCAITGGAFYNPDVPQFPAHYQGDYFFMDYCNGWIKSFDPESGIVSDFATGLPFKAVGLHVDSQGSLYYLIIEQPDRGLYRIDYVASAPPQIVLQPSSQTVAVGQAVIITTSAAGSVPLSFQWQKDGVDIPGATSQALTIAAVALGDSGDYRAVVVNAFGTATSSAATLTVLNNQEPVPTIHSPTVGTNYSAGEALVFSGWGSDAEDGLLPLAALTWRIDFHHDAHTHPFVPPTAGIGGGSVTIPTSGETSANVWYRVHLTVVDSVGLTSTSFVDVFPNTSRMTFGSNVVGAQLTLDGSPFTSPLTVDGVVNSTRQLGVVSPQTISGRLYEFVSWSDGGLASHSISTPATDTTYTAIFNELGAASGEISNANLVAHLRFDEGAGSLAADTSPLGADHRGALQAGAGWSAGKRNSAVTFDGNQGRVDIPDSVDLNASTLNQLSIGVWFRADHVNISARKQVIYEQGGAGRGLNIYLDAGNLYVGAWNLGVGGWPGTYLSTNRVMSGVWHHVQLVLDAGSSLVPDGLIAYLDGAEIGRGLAMQSRTHLGDIGIGRSDGTTRFHDGISAANVNGFAGSLDDLRVYHRPLSVSEVLTLATVGGSGGAADLVAHLAFDDGAGSVAADTSTGGSNNPGMLLGGAEFDPSGQGGAVRLDGVSAYVDIADSSDINAALQQRFSVSLWFQADDVTLSSRKQVLYEQGGFGRGLNIYLYDGRLYVGQWSDGPTAWPGTYLNVGQINAGEWNHVALTVEGNLHLAADSLRGYLNGRMFGSGTGRESQQHLGDIGIGRVDGATRFHDGNSLPNRDGFAGLIDDLRIYTSRLSDSDIAALAASGPGDQGPGGSVSIDTLTTYFALDEGTGSVVGDTSAQGADNSATLQGGAVFDSGGTGGAVRLNGGTAVVSLPDSVDINAADHAELAVSLWFRADNVGVASRKQVLFEQGGADRGLNIYLHDGRLYLGQWNSQAPGSWTNTYLSSSTVTSGVWHHVVLQIDGSGTPAPGAVRGSIDGVEIGEGTGMMSRRHLGDIGVGRAVGQTRFHDGETTGLHGFAGLMDEFRIYNRVLTPAEIAELASTGPGN